VAINRDMMDPWAKHTSGAFHAESLPGSHFYLTEVDTKGDFERLVRREVGSVVRDHAAAAAVRGGDKGVEEGSLVRPGVTVW
jgi:surfactin synthase thioesterase subunit